MKMMDFEVIMIVGFSVFVGLQLVTIFVLCMLPKRIAKSLQRQDEASKKSPTPPKLPS